MYQFRKTPEGWQRRESPRHPWKTLRFIEHTVTVNLGNSTAERIKREWVWE